MESGDYKSERNSHVCATADLTILKQFIENLSPFSHTGWEAFQGIFRERTLKKGEYLIKSGQKAKEFGFLTDGIVRAFFSSEDGKEYNKHFFVSPGFVGGYASLVSDSINQISQQALTNCKVLIAEYSKLRQLFDTHHDVERVARVMAEQFFVDKEQREIEIVLLNAEDRYDLFQTRFSGIEQLIPQYHIASYLGITPTQLSRIRKKRLKSHLFT